MKPGGVRRWVRAAALAVAIAAIPMGSAQAQWESPRGWHRLSVGVGPAEARGTLVPENRHGISALAAFEVVALSHLEMRFSGTLFEGRGELETQLGGAALDVVIFPWRGRVQPYAGGGVGVYLLTVEDSDPSAVDPLQDHKGLAWTALVGTRVQVGPITPFVEWRRTEFASGAPMKLYAPLLLGLHF